MKTLPERALLLLLGILTASCGAPPPGSAPPASTPSPGSDDTSGDVQLSADQAARGGIQVSVLQEETWTEAIDAPAVLQLDQRRTVRVGALLDARVDDIRVEVGDAVRQGTVLAHLHSHVTHDAVAAMRKAISAIARFEGELAYARSSQARYERLLADKAASPQDVERAVTTVASLGREIEMARAEETRARAELQHYGVDVAALDRDAADGHPDDRIPVRTPMAGIVLERLITPGTTVTSGQPMFVVSDLSTLWVVGEVDERYAPLLQPGRNATVRVSAFPSEVFTARVTYIGDVVAADTRRITVRADLPNGDRRLKPEMYARLVLSGAQRTALTVPAEAVQRVDGRDVVFVETTPNRFTPVPVHISPQATGGRVALLEGVMAGSRVVTQGAFLVRSEFQKAILAEEP